MPNVQDAKQRDRSMRPLSSFLFKCEFRSNGDRVLTDSVLKMLMYSVADLVLPKMKPMRGDTASYGSFVLSFPFFSTGERDMEITFYDTDDLDISKLFYYLQSKNRWKASTMYRQEQADLSVNVSIYDQRNTFGRSNRLLFSQDYALKVKVVNPPTFSKTSDVHPVQVKIEFNTLDYDYELGSVISPVDPISEMKRLDKRPDVAFLDTAQLGDKMADMFAEFKVKTRDPDEASSVDRFSTDMVSSDRDLREFADKLGANSMVRLADLSGREDVSKIDDLRSLLKKKGVNTKDYSEVSKALTDMGIFGTKPNKFCQRGVSVLEAIVTGQSKRVMADSATNSISAWRERGYVETDRKKIDRVEDADKYIAELAASGKIREGDKIIIDYDKEKKEHGHALTLLYDRERGWHTSSDAEHKNLSGLSPTHKIDEIHILRRGR